MSEERREIFSQLATHSQVGLVFVFSILIGFGLGWYLDQKVFEGRTAPWFTLIFLAFGIGAGFRNLWKVAVRELKEEK
jgi:F0F1-type ATP synthase assembly protein I